MPDSSDSSDTDTGGELYLYFIKKDLRLEFTIRLLFAFSENEWLTLVEVLRFFFVCMS